MTDEPEIQVGQSHTEEDVFWLAWGRAAKSSNIGLANEVLKTEIGIATALTAGAVLFADESAMSEAFVLAVLVLLMLSLLVALVGLLPRVALVDPRSSSEIKWHAERVLRYRLGCVKLSAVFLFLGLLASVVGVAIGLCSTR